MKTNQSQKNIYSHWIEKELGEVTSFFNGKAHENDIVANGKYIVINSKFVSTSGSIAKYTDTPLSLLKKGDVVMVMSDVPNGKAIAKCFLVDEDSKYTLNQRIGGFRSKEINSYFLYFLLNRNKYFLAFDDGVNQTNLRKDDILECPLYFPPLSEQDRIVSVLETWDKTIEKLLKKIEVKKQIKKGLMQNLLTGKKRLDGYKEGWELAKLSDIGHFSKGMGVLKDEVTEIGHNVIRYGELYTKYNFVIEKVFSHIPESVVASTKKIKYGDILFAGSGETIDEIGKSAAYLLKEDCYAGGDTIIFSPINADSLFLAYFLNSGEARKKLSEVGQGQSVVHLYKSDMEKLVFKLPVKAEQIAISKILLIANREIQELQKKLEIIREQKKYLLNNLITGTIRTPETLSTNDDATGYK